MFNVSTECKECKGKILVNQSTIVKKTVVCEENDEPVIITYFECKHCGKRHVVQIDNLETESLLKELTKKVARMSRFKKQKIQMSNKEATKITKIRTDLADKRLELVKEYQGKHYKDDDIIYCFEVVVLNG